MQSVVPRGRITHLWLVGMLGSIIDPVVSDEAKVRLASDILADILYTMILG